ncbi:fungal-specific transcription factor domain-containing protein [Aspergillus novoparasiticus]|uniref:Fungal-specific transcription factor domain-containing protein n=1 Tax=Aspergillus novoparasiticus TaxID=986946 RepID=A0A5N6F0U4_9EURO|nr:fungal-specific transcription factor domain-containing protein [Aspergillus novoparasiticus]
MTPSPRERVPRACEHCRSRKIKCNGEQPCNACSRNPQRCVYRTGSIRNRKSRQNREQPRTPATLLPAPQSPAVPGECPNIRLVDDPAHYKRQYELRAGIGVSNPETGNFQFYGPSSGCAFLQRIYQRIQKSPARESLLNCRTGPVPDGLLKWGVERFMFTADADGDLRRSRLAAEAFLPQGLGDVFIEAYFRIVHPQMPVLVYTEIIDSWKQMWETPIRGRPVKNQEILFMVLALGARVIRLKKSEQENRADEWAEYFSSRVSEGSIFMQEPSVKGVNLMLLKAMYSLQLMRQNDAYLYLGHATRTAMVLGLHRSQVTCGREPHLHRLRHTFWIMYVFERLSSVYMGRPSSLSDNQIDTAYPEDIPCYKDEPFHPPAVECTWTRVMADIAKLADHISVDVYSPASIKSLADTAKVEQTLLEYDAALQATTRCLPEYLHFFDESVPVGEDWQEIQRLSLGFAYNVVRMLLYRPALVLTTFFTSTSEAQRVAAGCIRLQECIDNSTAAARNLISLAHDVYFRRFPDIRYDGALASYMVSAIMTLLYDVLNLGTEPDKAHETFAVVEQGIRCLDDIEHTGYTVGKVLSMDLMKVAKQAVLAADPVVDTNQVLVDSFPWLDNFTPTTTIDTNPVPTPYMYPQDGSFPVLGTLASDVAMLSGSQVNCQWLSNGLDPRSIPGCLH